MRSRYWSCSKFADWLRGTNKLSSATGQGWAQWEQASKTSHPVRYWLAEEGLSYLQDFVYYIPDRLNDIRYYINNRWVSHSHALTAHARDIQPGTWSDVGNRFLPCLFNELVDFVEVETAWHHCAWSEEARAKFNVPWHRSGWLRWRTWRCPQAGIEHLVWAGQLRVDENDPTSEYTYQAQSAQEILSLYHWWVDVYPTRQAPHDMSGWTAWCDRRRKKGAEKGLGATRSLFGEDETPAEQKTSRKLIELSQTIEQQQNQEDEDMMVRLIRVRQSLWT